MERLVEEYTNGYLGLSEMDGFFCPWEWRMLQFLETNISG
jgi:hypothetical protein